jgi:hypothetical protein
MSLRLLDDQATRCAGRRESRPESVDGRRHLVLDAQRVGQRVLVKRFDEVGRTVQFAPAVQRGLVRLDDRRW